MAAGLFYYRDGVSLKYYTDLKRLLKWLQPMHISHHSAYTAFFLILSLFPCMLLLLGLLKYTPFGVRELLQLLEGLLPETLLPVAEAIVQASYDHSTGALISLSAAAALWSASRGMRGLVQGLCAVQGQSEQRGYLPKRAASMGYTLIFLLILVVVILVQVLLRGLADYLLMTTKPHLMWLLGKLDLNFLSLLLLLSLLFSAMQAWLPFQRTQLRRNLPGGALAALGWLGSAELFSVYMQYFAGYTNIFGSLYGLALGMLWLYFCISLIFYGGALNRLIYEKKWKI